MLIDKQSKEQGGERFLAGSRPEAQPAAPAEEVDFKIKELEQQLEHLKGLKEEERLQRLNELQEIQAREEIPGKYKQQEERLNKKLIKPGRAQDDVENLSGTELLSQKPEEAVANLVALATRQSDGFEKALALLKSIAYQPGGPWILDQFHLRMTPTKK